MRIKIDSTKQQNRQHHERIHKSSILELEQHDKILIINQNQAIE